MKKMRLILFVVYYLLLSYSAIAKIPSDHAPLDGRHIQVAELFKEKHLKDNGHYSIEKVENFIQRLVLEKKSLASDLRETTLYEELEARKASYAEAKKEAAKESDERKQEMLKAYNVFLLVKMNELKEGIQNGVSETELDAIVDEFIKLYVAYYIPNRVPRTEWEFIKQEENILVRTFNPYKFNRDTSKDLEANNLTPGEDLAPVVSQCLQTEVDKNHLLTQTEIEKIKDCDIDVSKFNPGKSPLWHKISDEERKRIVNPDYSKYPTSDTKLTFTKMRLSGLGSPKFNAKYIDQFGDERTVKIKVGREVHSDIASSNISKFLGFNQDSMKYAGKVRLYLGKRSYEFFRSAFVGKYGHADFSSYITGKGRSNGEDWVEFIDATFELSPDEELRISSLDPEAWDFQNRREYRASLLYYSFVNMLDTKDFNFKVILQESVNEEGQTNYVVLHRLQDTGFSLGGGNYFKHIMDATRNIGRKYNIDQFHEDMMDSDKESVGIYWNDFFNKTRRFQTTTFNDVKWMARQIAKMSREEILWAFTDSGMPASVADLYKQKIIARRNEIVKAFKLEDEFEIYDIPKMSHYNPPQFPEIKDGVMKATYFEGHNDYVHDPENIFTKFSSFLNYNFSSSTFNVFDGLNKSLQKNIHATLSGNAGVSLDGLSTNLALTGDPIKTPISSVAVYPGINLIASRQVAINPLKRMEDGKSNTFVVMDTFGFEISVSSPFFKNIAQVLPLSVSADVKVYRKEIKLIHFAETRMSAYYSPFKLFQVIVGIESFAANHLNKMEVVSVTDTYGIQLNASITAKLGLDDVSLTNCVNVGVVWKTVSPVYFTRNEFNELHVFKEKSTQVGFNLGATIAELAYLDNIRFPVLGIGFTYNKFFYEAHDYQFKLPNYLPHVENTDNGLVDAKVVTMSNANDDLAAYWMLFENDGETKLPVMVREVFSIKASGANSNFFVRAFSIFNSNKSKSSSVTNIKLASGKEYKFYHQNISYADGMSIKGDGIGISFMVSGFNMSLNPPTITEPVLGKFTKLKAYSIRADLEMDENDPWNFIANVETYKYHRSLSRSELDDLFSELNLKFSKSSDEPFYRDYVLPDVSDKEGYRNLMASTKIYFKGNALIEFIKNNDKKTIDQLIDTYFDEGITKQKYGIKFWKTLGAKLKKASLKRNAKSAINHIRELIEKEKKVGALTEKDKKKVSEYATKFLYGLEIDKIGIGFLKNNLGTESFFIVSQIQGIHDHYSAMEQPDNATAGRRFMAHSWGKHPGVAPIQRFLRDENYLSPSVFVSVQPIN
ncbi:MAG: hypothetical protein U0T83_09775 [Bacteriovoracaceae bacterium]